MTRNNLRFPQSDKAELATAEAAESHGDTCRGSKSTQKEEHKPREKPMIAETPEPPYYAVIFSSVRTGDSATNEAYSEKASRMVELAAQEAGFLGVESARDGLGITVSYWKDTESIRHWKQNCEHMMAQDNGKKYWYSAYKTRVCKVERDYDFHATA